MTRSLLQEYMTLHRAEECLASFFSVSVSPVFFFSYQILPLLFYRLPYRRKAAEQLTFLSYLKNIELFSESQPFTNYHSQQKIHGDGFLLELSNYM